MRFSLSTHAPARWTLRTHLRSHFATRFTVTVRRVHTPGHYSHTTHGFHVCGRAPHAYLPPLFGLLSHTTLVTTHRSDFTSAVAWFPTPLRGCHHSTHSFRWTVLRTLTGLHAGCTDYRLVLLRLTHYTWVWTARTTTWIAAHACACGSLRCRFSFRTHRTRTRTYFLLRPWLLLDVIHRGFHTCTDCHCTAAFLFGFRRSHVLAPRFAWFGFFFFFFPFALRATAHTLLPLSPNTRITPVLFGHTAACTRRWTFCVAHFISSLNAPLPAVPRGTHLLDTAIPRTLRTLVHTLVTLLPRTAACNTTLSAPAPSPRYTATRRLVHYWTDTVAHTHCGLGFSTPPAYTTPHSVYTGLALRFAVAAWIFRTRMHALPGFTRRSPLYASLTSTRAVMDRLADRFSGSFTVFYRRFAGRYAWLYLHRHCAFPAGLSRASFLYLGLVHISLCDTCTLCTAARCLFFLPPLCLCRFWVSRTLVYWLPRVYRISPHACIGCTRAPFTAT